MASGSDRFSEYNRKRKAESFKNAKAKGTGHLEE